jgi:hypothetical protein
MRLSFSHIGAHNFQLFAAQMPQEVVFAITVQIKADQENQGVAESQSYA